MAVTSPRPADNHDYRECFYDSQPDRGRAAQVCPRFPCRVYREGYEHGRADGHADGHGAGYSAGYGDGHGAGYSEGYGDGQAAAQGQDGTG